MAPFPFMKLPRETRDKVYSCCLMVEGHITPYPEYHRYRRDLDYKGDKLRSFIGILSVSELVHDEAAPIFYGKNTFRISAMAKDLDYGFMLNDASEPKESIKPGICLGCPKNTLWASQGHLIRHAIFYYHYNDYDHARHMADNIENFDPSEFDEDDHAAIMHGFALDEIKASWHAKMKHLQCFENLTTLSMNVTDLYCSVGCCRLDVLQDLFEEVCSAPIVRRFARIVFEGLKSEAELDLREIVEEKVPKCLIETIQVI